MGHYSPKHTNAGVDWFARDSGTMYALRDVHFSSPPTESASGPGARYFAAPMAADTWSLRTPYLRRITSGSGSAVRPSLVVGTKGMHDAHNGRRGSNGHQSRKGRARDSTGFFHGCEQRDRGRLGRHQFSGHIDGGSHWSMQSSVTSRGTSSRRVHIGE
jgi:hypothetical protein